MRISDWSSDVCSSDLPEVGGGIAEITPALVTMFDHAPDREGPRQQPRRTTRVAALEQRADAAGGDDLTLHRHRRHGIDREAVAAPEFGELRQDRKSTRLNSSH